MAAFDSELQDKSSPKFYLGSPGSAASASVVYLVPRTSLRDRESNPRGVVHAAVGEFVRSRGRAA
eukprot:3387699-Rhodomonas_salina.3